jgi:dTDP-4-amino-4,6-dideoxygalactose transaminase/8-oxo-dGTP pyrophosphatase MutT (NUDIX family)
MTRIDPKNYEHPIISDEVVDSVTRQLFDDISLYDNGGIYREVEDALKELFQVPYGLTVCNGTSALFSMYYGAGIGHGDEVIVPAYTFFATASPLFLLGAVPVLVDCDESGNIDPEQVSEKVTSRTKAIVITHMWGIPGKMDRLAAVAKDHGLLLLEDASHAHGATYEGRVIGSFSDGAAWSLQGKKILTAGEGGFFATKHQAFFERAVLLGHFNKRAKKDVTLPEFEDFTVTGLGGNLRMHPLGAAVLRPQLAQFTEQLQQRRETAALLTETVTRIDGLENVPVPANVNPAWYAFNFFFDADAFRVSREEFVDLLVAEGGIEFDIPGSTCPLNRHPLFIRPADVLPSYRELQDRFEVGEYPVAETFHGRIIKLPTWHGAECMEYARYHADLLEECAARVRKHAFSSHPMTELGQRKQVEGKQAGIDKFAVGAVVVHEEQVLLLRRRSDHFMGGIYELPSGTIERGEDPVTALLREVEEETGLNISDVLGVVSDFDYTSASGANKRQITFVVKVRDVSQLRLSDEHDAFMWAKKDDLFEKDEVDETMTKLCSEALGSF